MRRPLTVLAALAGASPTVLAAQVAPTAQTVAGTPIIGVATLHGDGAGAGIVSNVVTLIVPERLDLTLERIDTPAADSAVVVLTNTGNGHEAFVVTAGAQGDDRTRLVAVDADRDGVFDPAHDAVLAHDTTPSLAPGETMRLVLLVDGLASTLPIVARPVTGSGPPGTLLPGVGDGGSDAVVGATGAEARLAIVPQGPPTIVQTQAVVATDGDTTLRHGAVVAYTLTARFVSGTPAASLIDPIPADTSYVPASLTLDDVALPDAGHLADGRVLVSLGAVPAGAVRRLRFQVVIQ
jgi:uncharacterized repeat protein (TIGR01451 family)